MLKPKIFSFTQIFLCFLSLLLSLPCRVHAGGVYDYDTSTYSEDFLDNSGLASRVNTATDGALKLTDNSNAIAAPYVATGTAITSVLAPATISSWGTLTLTTTTPTSTSIKVQVVDEAGTVFPDELLSGNETGFTTNSVDLSSLPVDRTASIGGSKIARIAFKFTLTTSDTSVTPALDGFVLNWTKTRGDLTSSALSTAGWALPTGDVFHHSQMSGVATYLIPKWVKDQGVDYGGSVLRGSDEIIYSKTQGGIVSWPTTTNGSLSALDRRTGETIWEKDISGYAFSSPGVTLSANGTIYMNDNFNDVLVAYDASDGSVKWLHQFGVGHGNGTVNIGPDGTIYMVKSDSGDDSFSVMAFNSDGSTKWGVSENPAAQVGAGQVSIYGGNILVPTSGLSGGSYNGTGVLYAFDADTGAALWNYSTGDANDAPTIDTDGTIYIANNNNFLGAKSIFALNPDGTLKWQHSIGSTTDYWGKMALRDDGVLLAVKINSAYPDTGGALEAIDTSDGSLLWSETLVSTDDSFGSELIVDGANGAIVRSVVYTESTSLDYYDANHVNKWTWNKDTNGVDEKFNFISGDEDGNVYASIFTGGDNGASASKLVALSPWNIDVSISAAEIDPGETITISAESSMPELDPVSNTANKMQAIMADGSKVALEYVSADANGTTLWQGDYIVPEDASGTYNFNVEANSSMMSTDTATHFDSPANISNTGRLVQSSYTVTPAPEPRHSSSGGGGRKKISLLQTPTTPDPIFSNDCQVGFKFNPFTGKPCLETRVILPSECVIISTLKQGSIGEQVKCLQAGLGIAADGFFGPMTKASVILFQENHDLVPDGIFGPKSLSVWNKINWH